MLLQRTVLLVLLLFASATTFGADKPHIVYLLADDLGWQDLGYLGKEIKTPAIDKIADGALRLNQFYVQPYSTQTRAALLTGRYPMRYGLQTLSILPSSQYGLPSEERTLAQALKEAGYRTAFVGKWQLGHGKPEMRPSRRGFDTAYGSLNQLSDRIKKTHALGPDWWRNDKPLKEDGYETTLIGKEAASIIAKHEGTAPLFLMVSFAAPAAPLQAPKEFTDRYANITDETRRTYAGMIAAMDDAIGMITSALEKKAALDNTIIVFHSDNGGAVAHKFATGDGDVTRSAASNGPFRDGKGSIYEGGVRVPALMRWPKGLEGGTMGGLVHVTDMYPTLLKLAGGSVEQRRPLDGMDQWPAIKDNKASARKDVLITAEDFRAAIRVGDWKLVVYSTMPQRVELYDVPHDQGEEDNAADRNAELVKDMTVKLNEYLWEMSPSKYMDELLRARKTDMPMVWGANPPRLGTSAQTDNRKDPSLTVERADQPKKE